MPRKDGWKRASGHRNLSLPMVITWRYIILHIVTDKDRCEDVKTMLGYMRYERSEDGR